MALSFGAATSRALLWPRWPQDARLWQILSLGLLLIYGLAGLGFDQTPCNVALILSSTLAIQWVCCRTLSRTPFDPLSPIITALSLCLLLRASSPTMLVLGALL